MPLLATLDTDIQMVKHMISGRRGISKVIRGGSWRSRRTTELQERIADVVQVR